MKKDKRFIGTPYEVKEQRKSRDRFLQEWKNTYHEYKNEGRIPPPYRPKQKHNLRWFLIKAKFNKFAVNKLLERGPALIEYEEAPREVLLKVKAKEIKDVSLIAELAFQKNTDTIAVTHRFLTIPNVSEYPIYQIDLEELAVEYNAYPLFETDIIEEVSENYSGMFYTRQTIVQGQLHYAHRGITKALNFVYIPKVHKEKFKRTQIIVLDYNKNNKRPYTSPWIKRPISKKNKKKALDSILKSIRRDERRQNLLSFHKTLITL